MFYDYKYLEELKYVLEHGLTRTDRTGVGTKGVFGRIMRFDLSDGSIPLLTSKKMHIPSIIHELLWYIAGESNIKYLQENGVRIWNEWADENGDLGPVYPTQWRKWKHAVGAEIDYLQDPPKPLILYQETDQLQGAIDLINNDPTSRRILVNSWNVGDLPNMNLPPCHFCFQFYVEDGKRLSCMLHQRSADIFLGVPFNIAQYSILTRIVAKVTNLEPGEFIWTGGDVHLYSNHVDQAQIQLERIPHKSPKLVLSDRVITNINDIRFEDFSILNYDPHPTIKASVAV